MDTKPGAGRPGPLLTWPFAPLDTIQARNHLAATAAVQRIAAQAQAARLDACLRAWRQGGAA